MPICKICGKTLKNPNAKSHINSKDHQEKLKEIGKKARTSFEIKTKDNLEISVEVHELKILTSNLERRIAKIEKVLKVGDLKESYKTLISDEINIEREIITIINQKSNLQNIKGNFILKDLRDILLEDYNIPEYKFEETILRLYRKQAIDLQPGGNPREYHLLSPTGKKFYYLIAKN